MKKILFLILILAIIGVAIWSGLQKEPVYEIVPPVDQIEKILMEAKNVTELNFSEIKNSEFGWLKDATSTQTTISGKEISISNISVSEQENIDYFLIAKGFVKNNTNVARGTVSELQGYEDGTMVCIIISGLTGYKDAPIDWVSNNDNKDVNLACGFFEVPIETSIVEDQTTSRDEMNKNKEEIIPSDLGESVKPSLE